MDKKVKQTIIFRKDLLKGEKSIRRGKFASQVAHSSMAVILNMMEREEIYEGDKMILTLKEETPIYKWINGLFTKICVSCENEEELLKLYEKAKSVNIPTALITDAGLTEFNNIPTNTCIAIGPYWSEDINEITGHLPLL